MSLILSKSSSGSGLFQEKTVCPPTVTTTLFSIPATGVAGMKIWITIIDTVAVKVHISEILVALNGSVTKHNRFGHVGEKVNCALNIIINAGNLELLATNNEVNAINITTVSQIIYK